MTETQTKPTHMLGPWNCDYNRFPITVYDKNGEAVVYIIARDTLAEELAHAHLIEATPELFEALTMCRGQWIHSVNAERCLAAIAKATRNEA